MADKVEEVRVLKRGGGAAATFAFIAMVLSIIAFFMARRAVNRASTATDKANTAITRTHDLGTKVDNALGSLNKANTGSGVGGNNPQPAAGTNTTPNANGQ